MRWGEESAVAESHSRPGRFELAFILIIAGSMSENVDSENVPAWLDRLIVRRRRLDGERMTRPDQIRVI